MQHCIYLYWPYKYIMCLSIYRLSCIWRIYSTYVSVYICCYRVCECYACLYVCCVMSVCMLWHRSHIHGWMLIVMSTFISKHMSFTTKTHSSYNNNTIWIIIEVIHNIIVFITLLRVNIHIFFCALLYIHIYISRCMLCLFFVFFVCLDWVGYSFVLQGVFPCVCVLCRCCIYIGMSCVV